RPGAGRRVVALVSCAQTPETAPARIACGARIDKPLGIGQYPKGASYAVAVPSVASSIRLAPRGRKVWGSQGRLSFSSVASEYVRWTYTPTTEQVGGGPIRYIVESSSAST